MQGNLLGNLTIEAGANVVIEGSVDGKIINQGDELSSTTKDLPPACISKGHRKRRPAAS